MKISSLNKIRFHSDAKVKIAFTYCGPASMNGLEANALASRSIEKTKSLAQEVSEKRRAEWESYQKNVLNALHSEYEKLLKEFYNKLPDYLIHFLELLLPHITPQAETIKHLVEMILKENEANDALTLLISPNDVKWIKDLEKEFKQNYPHLITEEEGTLHAGEFRLKTSLGEIDGRLKTRLDELKHRFIH